jgi:outer membrane protein TolC
VIQFLAVLRLLAVLPLLAASGVSAAQAPLAPLSLYEGAVRDTGGESRVELRLLDDNFFVLSSSIAPQGGPAVARDIVGRWERTRGGDLLQLTNLHGLALRLNVGGEGTLYGDFRLAPDRPAQSFALKEAPFRARSFVITGRLERREGRAVLTDSASGRIFTPVTGAVPAGEEPLFVEVEGMPAQDGFAVKRVRSVSARMPERSMPAPAAGDVADIEDGARRLPAPAGARGTGTRNLGTQAAETFTMAEAAARAVKANPGVEAKLLLLEQARMNVGEAQSYFWPRVSLVASRTRIRNDEEVQTYNTDDLGGRVKSEGLRLSLSLFAGFAHLNNLEQSRISVDVEKARHRQAVLELGCNVQLQFLQLLKCREDLKSAESAVQRLETQLKAAEKFVKVDMAPYVNVLQNRTELSRAEQQVIRVRNDIRNAEVQLNTYLGFPPARPVRYVGALGDFHGVVSETEEDAVKTAESMRPDLIAARKSVEVAYKAMHVTMGQFLPRVDAVYDDMSYTRKYEDVRYKGYTRNYWSAGLNFTWDIFTGGSTTFASLAERKRAQALQKDYENAVSGARADVIRALLDIRAAAELIGTSRIGVDAARESYAMADKRYMTGIGTITELLDAQLRLAQAETDAAQALTEYHAARARFYFHTGRENPGLTEMRGKK